MTSAPVRLAVPLLSCALLLTACPGGPRVINVPSSPSVLNGTWMGELTSTLQVGDAALYDGRVLMLQSETVQSLPFMVPLQPAAKVSVNVVALDAATGSELQRVTLPDATTLRLRAAQGSAPARLVVLRRLPSQDQNMTRTTELVELDPLTLAERRRVLVPGGQDGSGLSADGRRVLRSQQAPLDSLTLQPALLSPALQAQLDAPQTPATRLVAWEFGDRFLRVSTTPAAPSKAPWATRYYAAEGDSVFGAAPLHPLGCPEVDRWQLENPTDMVSLPDGGAALAYSDGVIELRGPQDQVRRTVNTGACLPIALRADGDVLTFVSPFDGKLGTLRASDGAVLSQRTANPLKAFGVQQPIAQGTVLLTNAIAQGGPLMALERVTGPGWSTARKVHTLNLETQATWVSKTAYTSAGTAVLDGEKLNFSATADSGSYELRSQAVALRPVTWQGELRRADGHLVARVSGRHSDEPIPLQFVGLEVQDVDRDFAFSGQLKH